ncbi:MAG: thioredoxin domain-containing protein, partial [Syntrophobacteraceae bacterium]
PNCRAKNRIPPSRADERAVCGKCRTPLPRTALFPENPVEVSDQSFSTEALSFPGPVAALFWAPWCGHCARLMPDFNELASEFSGYVKFIRIELDKNPATTAQYNVRSVPALFFFKGGRIIDQVLGAVPKYQIEHHLQALLRAS